MSDIHTWFYTNKEEDVQSLNGVWQSRCKTYTSGSKGPIGFISSTKQNTSDIPLFRLYKLQSGVYTWFYTTKEEDVNGLKGEWESRCNSYTSPSDGPIGYISSTKQDDSDIPLFRLYKLQSGVHTWFYTTKEEDVNALKGVWESRCNSYTSPSDGPIGYISSKRQNVSDLPFFRLYKLQETSENVNPSGMELSYSGYFPFFRLYKFQSNVHTWFYSYKPTDVHSLKGVWENRCDTYTSPSKGPIGFISSTKQNTGDIPLFRLYKLQSGVHTWFYTTKEEDVKSLKGEWESRCDTFTSPSKGPIGFISPILTTYATVPLYRLYKLQSGIHTWFYTTKEGDVNALKGEWESRCNSYTSPSDGPIGYLYDFQI